MLIFPFLKSLSFAKILNLIKIFFSYAISTAFKIPFAWGLPVIINIEPTNLCNLSCLHCPTGAGKLSRKTGYMDNGFLENIISQIQKHSIAVQLYFQGEPFLNKNLLEFIKIIKENHNFLIINTNGHFFEETVYLKKLVHLLPDKIIISLDGATEETYKVYRKNGDFNKVVNGIKNIVSVKKELGLKLPRIVMQFIVMKHNEQEIDQVKEMSENLGVDKLELKTAQLYDWHEIKDFIPDDRKYSRYIESNDNTNLKFKRRINCFRAWATAVITWDGEVLPCCFDKNADYSYGNLKEGLSFEEIWTSEKAKIFRKAVLKNRDKINICKNCTLGVKVRIG